MLLAMLVGQSIWTARSTVSGDCNEDGVVDLGDVVYLINYLYKDGTAPDPPQNSVMLIVTESLT